MSVSKSRLQEIMEFCLENGEEKTRETFGISQGTLEKYKKMYKNQIGDDINKKIYLKKIFDRFSEAELKSISEGSKIIPEQHTSPKINFDGDEIIFGALGDSHIGSIYFKEELLDQAIEECKKEGCQFIAHTGDLVDGMSRRPGHVYELEDIGYNKQKDRAIDCFSRWEKPWYFIDGNHDRWYCENSNNGALIVKDICKELGDNATFLGHDEGDIILQDNIKVRLWHGIDSSSYATSYRLQKLVESFSGGEKPNILLAGHVHKMGYFFERNIHCVSTGAICLQSRWMRGKRLANHSGFWIIRMTINDNGISKFQPTWYPFYQ